MTDALANATGEFLLQHMVVSVDQPESFKLQVADLYPPIAPAQQVFWRQAADGGAKCAAGSDAVASGCVGQISAADHNTELFDVSTAGSHCTQPPYAGGHVSSQATRRLPVGGCVYLDALPVIAAPRRPELLA